jgi:hypothetical protein
VGVDSHRVPALRSPLHARRAARGGSQALTIVDWQELWRLRLSELAGIPSSPDAGSDALDAPAPDAVRTRFFFVVARARMDLFLTIRRQFRDDRTVYVMLDRRAHDRRSTAVPVDFPDRRHPVDRRRPRDYWEDPAHHPAVIIPVAPARRESSDRDPRPTVEALPEDKETTMERGLVDETRVLAWVQEGRHVLQHVVPAAFTERDTLRNQLQEATRRCQELQAENDGLRAEVAKVIAQVLEPMRALADRLGQASSIQESVEVRPP